MLDRTPCENCRVIKTQPCKLYSLLPALKQKAETCELIFEIVDLTAIPGSATRRSLYDRTMHRVSHHPQLVVVLRVRTDDENYDRFNSGNCYTVALMGVRAAGLLRVRYGQAIHSSLDSVTSLRPDTKNTATTLCARVHAKGNKIHHVHSIIVPGKETRIIVARLDQILSIATKPKPKEGR